MQHKARLSFKELTKRGILFLFPWRDALGISIGSTPFRFGEIFAGFSGIAMAVTGKGRIKKSEAPILYILIINLIVSIVGVVIYNSTIDSSFAWKYIIRNAVYILFVFGFLKSKVSFSHTDIERMIRFLVLLQTLAFVLVLTTGYHLMILRFLGWNDIISTGQYVNVAGIRLPRFMGTSAEAGYLAPFLVMPIYFYINSYIGSMNQKKRRRRYLGYLVLTYVLAVFTFSTAVYAFAVLVTILALTKNVHKRRTQRILIMILIILVVLIIMISVIPSLSDIFRQEFLNKVLAYMKKGNASNWSAKDRSQHLRNAWNMFRESNPVQLFIGHGTGAYYARSKISTSLLVTDVDEAYNLFLSSLTDRGVVGFLCVILLLWFIQKKRTDSLASITIFVGVSFQYLHWMLTGNFWLYYFWYEIVILIGINRYEKRGILI